MNDQEKYKEDPLRQYINPERIEKAPEGFTSEIMTHIHIEAGPLKTADRLRNKSLVPLISSAIITILIVTAFLIPGREADSLALPLIKFFNNFKISLPEIDFSSVSHLNLPVSLISVLIGILILLLFDKALYRLFHKKE